MNRMPDGGGRDLPTEQWRRLEELLAIALELPAEARRELLDRECAGEIALRAELDSLIAAHEKAGPLDRPIARLTGSSAPPVGAEPALGAVVSHYELQERLGSGGMGVVYRARDLRLDRVVALKFLLPALSEDAQAKRRFLREARAAAALEHTNVCTVHEIGETEEGQLFLAMAFVDGRSLRQIIDRGPLPLEQVHEIARQVAAGLERAHSRGIVHRDIKPENVMVGADGVVKLVDFGVARLAGLTLTDGGAIAGTAAYMSPEQALGEGVDHRTDLWSLGVVLYEMLVGARPFEGEHPDGILYAIRHEEPEPVRALRGEVPEGLAQVVKKLLEKDPLARYQQAEEVLEDLRALRPVGMVPAKQNTGAPQPAPHRWIGVGALALLLLGLGLVLQWQASRTKPVSPEVGALAPADASPPALAVLPLKNNSGDPDQAYFAAGMSEALLAELSKVEALRVISLLQHDQVQKPLPEILKELDVRVVLEGGIVSSDGKVGIAVRLAEAGTGVLLWSERFERELRDVVTLQREVALAIAREIAGTLTPQEEARLAAAEAVDEEAFRRFLKGIHVRHNNDWDPRAPAAYFEQAVEKDPDYALAWAWLANVSATSGDKARAEHAVDKALALDPSLSEAYVALGLIREWIDWDWAGAEQAFRRAIELNPGDGEAHHELGQLLMRKAQFEEALNEMNRALQGNPLAPRFHMGVGEVYFYGRRYDEALEVFEEITERFPEFLAVHWYKGYVYLQKGMPEPAIEQFERWDYPGGLGLAYAAAGRSAEARQIHKTLAELQGTPTEDIQNLIGIPAALGDKETALDWLERAYEERDGLLVYLKVWPPFDPLRSEPRFEAVLKRVGLGE